MTDSATPFSMMLASLRAKFFGTITLHDEEKCDEHDSSGKLFDSCEPETHHMKVNGHSSVNGVWLQRWSTAPDEWKRFVGNIEKSFGMTDAEEQKISSRNNTYVHTAELRRRAHLGTSALCLTVGTFSKVLLNQMNTMHVHRLEILHDAIERREKGRGLLTVCNHQSVMDDPFLLGSLLPARILVNAQNMRWGLCSLDICFQERWISRTLRLGKALPIRRRGGMGQQFLRDAGDKLSNGDWVHVFPEGRVRQWGMGYFKRGVGKVLAIAYEKHNGHLPLIVPMYHEGIEQVMPHHADTNKLKSVIPRCGKSMFVLVGEPVDVTHIFRRLMPACQASGGTTLDSQPCLRLYEEVADFLAIITRLLRAEARQLVRKEYDVDLGQPYEQS